MRTAGLPSALHMGTVLAMAATLFQFSPVMSGQEAWKTTGGPEGGYIHDLCVGKSGNLYAVTDIGIFRSINDGMNWDFVSTPSGIDPISRICAVGYNHIIASSRGGIVYRSTNLGVQWSKVHTLSAPGAVEGFIVCNTVMYVALNGTETASRGVYRSLDSGRTWQRAGNGLPDVPVHAMTADTKGNIVYAATSDGVFRSVDSGAQWQEVGALPGDHGMRVRSLAVDASGTIYAGIPSSVENDVRRTGALYRSSDGCASWSACANGLSFPDVLRIDVDTVGALVYIVQGIGNGVRYRSSDRGDTWHPTELRNRDTRSGMVFYLGTAFEASPFGIHASFDMGLSWMKRMTGIRAADTRAVVSGTDGSLFAATCASGLFRTRAAGVWEEMNEGLVDFGFTSLLRTHTGTLIAGSAPGYCFRSTNGGTLWEPLTLRVRSADKCTLAGKAPGPVLLGGAFSTASGTQRTFRGIMRSANDGITWTLVTDSTSPVAPFSALAAGRGSLFFAADDSNVWRSDDDGITWVRTDSAPTGAVYRIAFDTSSGFLYALCSSGLHRSFNNGRTWARIDTRAGAELHCALNVQNGTVVYSAPGVGIRYSTDAGESWGVDLRTRPWESASALITDSSGRLFAATSMGVWTADGWPTPHDTAGTLLPEPPVLIAPADADTAATITPTCVWWRVLSATKYSIQLSRTADFSDVVRDTTTRSTSVRFTGLQPGIVLYWHVRSHSATAEGTWSAARWFATNEAVPSVPLLLTPAQGDTAVSTSPEYSWWPADNTVQYQIQISRTVSFDAVEHDTLTTVPHLTIGSLPLSALRYWRVRGIQGVRKGAWSEARWFRVYHLPAPDSVRGLWPLDGMEGVALDTVCSWSPVPSATSYRIALLLVSDTVRGVYRETSYRPQKLYGWTTYRWKVAAKNPAGMGPWSAERTFTTGSGPLPAVQLLSPAYYEYVDTREVDLRWTSLPHATEYTVEVASDDIDTQKIWMRQTVPDTALHIAALPDTVYAFAWRVRALHGVDSGSWTEHMPFRHLLRVYLDSPPDKARNVANPALCVWEKLPAATQYRLQIDNDGRFATHIVLDTVLIENMVEVPGLPRGINHSWRVSAYNRIGPGPWSAVWTFTTGTSTQAHIVPDDVQSIRVENYPNPFSDLSTVRFTLPRAAAVSLRLYDLLGRLVLQLGEGRYPRGETALTLDGTGLPAGIYHLVLTAEGRRDVRPVTIRR